MTTTRKKSPPKRHVERPDLRTTLLDAAEALIRDEGYAAATARRIAGKVGLKHQVVFYYFGAQDDLLLALFKRAADEHRERLSAALNSDQPLRAMWDVISDTAATRLTLEFVALANHSEAIRSAIAENAKAIRELEVAAVEKHLRARGIKPRFSPQMVSILTNALARFLVQESAMGINLGHDEVEALVKAWLRQFETSGDAELMQPLVDALSPEH